MGEVHTIPTITLWSLDLCSLQLGHSSDSSSCLAQTPRLTYINSKRERAWLRNPQGPCLGLSVTTQRPLVDRLASLCESNIFLLPFVMHHCQHGSAAEQPRVAQKVPARSLKPECSSRSYLQFDSGHSLSLSFPDCTKLVGTRLSLSPSSSSGLVLRF